MSKDLRINEQIRDREVRVIDSDGGKLGILNINEAIQTAYEKELDLVLVAPNGDPPVCKIMDYGKYRFETSKREKEAKKKQKVINIKEIRLSPNIEDHDLNVKANRADKFLKSGDKVKVSMRFRGREMAHIDIGTEVMMKFAEQVKQYGVVEKKPRCEGRNMIMILTSKQE